MALIGQQYATETQKFNALVLKAKRLSVQLLSGSQQSIFKGKGIHFDKVRKYQPGDDIRTMHWSITAKLREPHVKLYSEEKNLTLWLLIDVSGSGTYGTHNQTKLETILELCAVLSFAAVKNNCSIGAIYFSNKIENVIKPKKGNAQCLKILHFLNFIEIKGKQTQIAIGLEYILKILPKGSLVIVLSDFMDDGYKDSLRVVGKKNELLGIRIFDKSEASFPPASFINFLDPETGKSAFVQTSSKLFQQKHNVWFKERAAYFQTSFEQAGAGILDIATDEIYIEKLLQYFQRK